MEPCFRENIKASGEHSGKISQLFVRSTIMSAKAEKIPGSSLNPSALEIGDAAKLLSKISGQTVSECMIEEDIESGAPVNANGTLNLVHYAAWLVKEMAIGD
jgi:hypothetical protein